MTAELTEPNMVPSELLQHLVDDGGSRIVLVVGAGTSMEAPTSLKSGREYSELAHERLLADGVLTLGDCATPEDLSALADVVFQKRGSQKELTSRLPKNAWRTASPNSGHLIAAALLLEGALRHIVSLNYDLAIQNAMSYLGNSCSISFVHGPHEHGEIGTHAVVYLHRSVDQDEETWVLRKSALDSEWRDAWEEVIAASTLSAAAVVFVGLGSPAGVLTESVAKLSAAANSSYYLVDENLGTDFATAVSGSLTGKIDLYWCAFMDKLAARLAAHQRSRIQRARKDFVASQPDLEVDYSNESLEHLLDLDLITLGKLRATWLLDSHRYLPEGDPTRISYIGHVLAGMAYLGHALEATQFSIDSHSRIEVTSPRTAGLVLGLAHGKGLESWASISAKVRATNNQLPPQLRTGKILVAGARSSGGFSVDDLLRSSTADDLIRGPDTLSPLFIDELPRDFSVSRDEALRVLLN